MMKRVSAFIISILVCTVPVHAADRSDFARYHFVDGKIGGVLTGQALIQGKSVTDTVYLLGGPERSDGKFEDLSGAPAAQGWNGVDRTDQTQDVWHCADYHCQNLDPTTVPNHAWWCGTEFANDCGSGDFGGYGNLWLEYLDWRGTVPDNSLATMVTVTALLNYDTESGYDYLYFEHETPAGMVTDVTYNGAEESVEFTFSFTVEPTDYIGANGDELHVRWRFVSDGALSDEDCDYPTQGAAQIDLISVYFDQGGGAVQQGTTEDCEDANLQWTVSSAPGCGDFAQVWSYLTDVDACRRNWTPQFAFIDDGIVVPGTGGYLCTSWCYGPEGYIVNPEGGLLGPDSWLHNEVWSPVLAWPGDQYTGAAFEFTVYRHEPLTAVSPGMFYVWHVRSTASDDPVDIEEAEWKDRELYYYGGPDYLRVRRTNGLNDVTDLLEPGRQYVQLSFGAMEFGWVWGYTGTDGTPAPYLDDVAFYCWEFAGPGMAVREINLAQDSFPAIGAFDFEDIARNSIRFDMAANISPSPHLRNDPGDSIWVDAVPVRTGSVLNDRPKLYYKLFPNPVFDPVRVFPDEAWFSLAPTQIPNRYYFDLPDSMFFFPGDIIHYYLEGQDNVSGDIGTTLIPADTTGFSGPPGYPVYNSSFRVQGLPSFFSPAEGNHPNILFWNDFANRGGEEEWYAAFHNLGYQPGADFDVYYTNGPSSGEGNGLGGRATSTQLYGYDTIIYSCGNLSVFTLSNGDFYTDAGDDLGVLDSWLRQGGASTIRHMFLTGDDLVFDLTQNAGANAAAFVSNWIGVNFLDRDVRSQIEYQTTPLVKPVTGNSLNLSLDDWIAYGGCLGINTFDAVTVAGTTERVAEFLDPNGSTNVYPYAAMTYHRVATYNCDIVYCPYDLMYVYTHDSATNPPVPSASRTRLLKNVLTFFGHAGSSQATSVAETPDFTVKNHPNPFNPTTRITFFLPQRGPMSLKVYNLRGELVKTLIDEVRPLGTDYVLWNGSDDEGRTVASGVYFYEARTGGEIRINKITLVK